MYSYDDIKMMYDWHCFTADQVKQFIPLCITQEEADKIIYKESQRVLKRVRFFMAKNRK